MTLTIKGVRGTDPRHNVFIDGVYAGIIRQERVGPHHVLEYVYKPTAGSPIGADFSYRGRRLGDLTYVMRLHLKGQARVAS